MAIQIGPLYSAEGPKLSGGKMKILLAFFTTVSLSASASILEDTRTDDVNESSIHLKCQLEDLESSEFASYSKVVIKTDFGDDGPNAVAYDANLMRAETAELTDINDFEALNMRIFEIQDYETKTLVNLIVVYSREGKKTNAKGVLTSNGKESPAVVNTKEIKCEYIGPMAING